MLCSFCDTPISEHVAGRCMDTMVSECRGNKIRINWVETFPKYSTDLNIAWKLVPEIRAKLPIFYSQFAQDLLKAKEPALFICKTLLEIKEEK